MLFVNKEMKLDLLKKHFSSKFIQLITHPVKFRTSNKEMKLDLLKKHFSSKFIQLITHPVEFRTSFFFKFWCRMTLRSSITAEMKYRIFLFKIFLFIIICFIILFIRPQMSRIDEICGLPFQR